MSRLYGIVTGAGKTTATRRGHDHIVTVAASWQGAVQTTIIQPHKDAPAMAYVRLVPWKGSGVERVLYEGPVSEYRPKDGH